MKKYLLFVGFFSFFYQCTAASMETEQPLDAKGICQSIHEKTPLEPPSKADRPKRFKKNPEDMASPAKEGYIASIYEYMVDHTRNEHTKQYKAQTIAWYAEAALLGDPWAFYRLGALAFNWDNDEARADIFMRAAADLGEPRARVWLKLVKEDF